MKRILLEGPASEPVLLAEAKAHLRLEVADEDDFVAALIAAARIAVEAETRRALIAQRWRVLAETWPAAGILLPVTPVLTLDVVRGIDAAGVATALPLAGFALEPADNRVRAKAAVAPASSYEIDFTAGYGVSAADVPQPLRQAIRMLVTHWFEHRSAVTLGDIAVATPSGYRALVAPYRRMALC